VTEESQGSAAETKKDESKVSSYRLVYFNKGDPKVPNGAVQSNAYEAEDEFQMLYVGGVNSRNVIMPPFFPRYLEKYCLESNAIGPNVEAMVENVDGTGYKFVKDGIDKETDQEDGKIKELKEFFGEPWPGESFTTIRKKLRRDIEKTGNGYLEVIPNAADEIVYVRHMDAKMTRILLLDDPVPVDKQVMRRGKLTTIKTMVRERRYCMMANLNRLRYFKEFGSSRDLDFKTGRWAKPGERLPAENRATSVIHFTAQPDIYTPYGLPRWIAQTPSVVGSRKAEEFNVDFFDNGGVPPILILLQGGILTTTTKGALEERVNQGAKKANRVQVIEMEPTGGSLDSANTGKITVERFGHDRQNDSMFEKYDDKCELRIRRSWRLPPIFVGQAHDYSFATAYASYSVAEAQVFRPQREEFDEVISIRLLPVMGYRGYRMISKPLHINDVNAQLKGVDQAVRTNHVAPDDVIAAINDICGLSLKCTPDPVLPWLVPVVDPMTGRAQDKAVGTGPVQTTSAAGNVPPKDVPSSPPPSPANTKKAVEDNPLDPDENNDTETDTGTTYRRREAA
jgi:PBSX family phage portal protein